MEIFNNHIRLYTTAFAMFVFLTLIVAIIPAQNNQENNAPLPGTSKPDEKVLRGKQIFISNGCVACHSQQVRNVEMDKVWGQRPSVAADYAYSDRPNLWYNSATLMGTERTGPDLTDVGNRQPSAEWNLMHLFNPRTVVEESIMPSYPWLFEVVESAKESDVVVNVPERFLKGEKGVVVAKQEALDLVAYIQSLKQEKLPDNESVSDFLYKKEAKFLEGNKEAENLNLDGKALYAKNCQSCHQANGEGLKGAFPPLKGSKIVLKDDPSLMVEIIMDGYNGREEFAVMPAVGTNNKLTPEEVAAIMNHEKTSWGNSSRKVTSEEVKKIIQTFNSEALNK